MSFSLTVSLSKLINRLNNRGFVRTAKSVLEILQDAIDDDQKENSAEDATVAANSIGLREDGTLENMNQGFSLEPAFTDWGTID